MAHPPPREPASFQRAVLARSSDAILVVDGDGTITFESPSTAFLFGYLPDALIGQPLTSLVHPDDHAAVTAAARALSGGARRQVAAVRVRRDDGAWLTVEVLAQDLRDDPDIRGVILDVRDITDRPGLQERLQKRALHDDVTGLPNRHLLRDRLGQAVARSYREASLPALLLVDISGFGTINERYGHDAADEVLRIVGARLRSVIRETDTAARVGADEFAVLLNAAAGVVESEEVAERLLAELRRPAVIDHAGQIRIRVEAHIGLSVGDQDTPSSIDEAADQLLRDADAALHEARLRPPGTAVTFQESMRVRMTRRHDLVEGIHRALTQGEFLLYYQPIVRLDDGSITAVEALLRWRDPERGLISPGEFIPVAEETGQIVPIGAWVLREATEQVAAWQRRFPSDHPLRVSVNVSPVQLVEGDIVRDVAAALAVSDLDPGCLTLEITESALGSTVEDTRRILYDLKALGVRLAVDDFGTGYSSLAYLHELPVDVLKIDRTFIDGMRNGSRSPALVEAIVSMGHSLRLETVAEGIEEPGQLDQSRALSCDAGQGYLFARPGRGIEIEALLAARARAVRYYSADDVDDVDDLDDRVGLHS